MQQNLLNFLKKHYHFIIISMLAVFIIGRYIYVKNIDDWVYTEGKIVYISHGTAQVTKYEFKVKAQKVVSSSGYTPPSNCKSCVGKTIRVKYSESNPNINYIVSDLEDVCCK